MKKILLLLLMVGTIFSQDIEDVWTVEKNDTVIFASVNGKITYGDKLIFMFTKNNPCDKPMWITSFYTMQPDLEKKFDQLPTKYLYATLNDTAETYITIIKNSPFLLGYSSQLLLGQYPIKNIQDSFGMLDEISVELTGIPESDLDIKSIYDITRNTFSTKNLNEALEQAKTECLKL